MPAKHNTVFPLRRYGFIGGASTLLVVLVAWVAVRAVGPAPDRVPLMVQPTIPLAAAPSVVAVTSSSPSSPTPSVSPSRSPSASPSKSRSASPSPSKSPSKRPSPRPSSPKPTTPAASFTARYGSGASWDRGFVAGVQLTNNGSTAKNWTVKVTYAAEAGVRFGNAWNARLDSQGDTAVLTGGPLAPGASVTLGFQATKQVRGKINPTSCTVAGGTCRLG